MRTVKTWALVQSDDTATSEDAHLTPPSHGLVEERFTEAVQGASHKPQRGRPYCNRARFVKFQRS